MEDIKNKINRNIILCFVCLFLLFGLSFGIFRLFVNIKLDKKTTYVASRVIAPRTIIKEDDLLEVEVADAYLMNNSFLKKEEIIGKITDIQGTIPAGSPFYKTMLYEVNKINDQATSLLKEGQTAYTMNTEMYKVTSFSIGNRVDLYLSINDKEKPLTGRLIKDSRILDIKDNKGISINSEESSKVPYYIELAVNQNDIEWLTYAESIGDIRLFLGSDQSNKNLEATLDEESEVYQYLNNILNTDKQKEEEKKEATPESKEEKKKNG